MRTVALLLLIAGTALACVETGSRRIKREELLRRAKRRWVLSTIEVTEEDPGPFPKEISQMYNDKQGTVPSYKFKISGVGVTEEPLNVFSIDEYTGKVYAHKPIDREYMSSYHIKFDILDRRTDLQIDKELSFDVEIKDINDNDPVFLKPRIVEGIKENIDEGFLPVQLHVVDPDQPNSPNSTMTITLLSQTPKEPKFEVEQLDDRTGHLKYSGCFNYDKENKYDIIAKVADHGKPPRSSTALITFLITDANTHLPTFKKTEYFGEVQEMATKNEVLRVAVDDKDTPNTPGWRAKYFFVKGNEDVNFKIVTDPKTNEGIFSVIKGKDSERTVNITIQIGVENVEPLFFCKYNPGKAPSPNTANITIKVTATNDPPNFDKDTTRVYQKEEEPSGQVLFIPKVTDPDSDIDKIRYVILDDPAKWMKIDPKTGNVSTIQKMDRESPFVNNSVYKILVGAIDDGEPPATGTGTVLVHLKDINDHKPTLLNNSVILCGNMNNRVPVKVQDLDAPPFSGPFSFALDDKDNKLKENWKLDPASGDEGGLNMLKSLAYDNYSIPLVIQDQQNLVSKETILVVVCECGETGVCIKQPRSVNIGGPAIGLILGALLLFLLLLLVFKCRCGKQFQKTFVDEGNQTLIKYNQEGGSSECKAEPSLFLMTTNQNNRTVTNGQKQENVQPGVTTIATDEVDNTLYRDEMDRGMQHLRDTRRNNEMYNTMISDMYTLSNRTNTYQSFSRYSHYGIADQHIADFLYTKLQVLSRPKADKVEYGPHEYAYEGEASICQSLDELSLANEDDLQFLDSLGPKFKTLGRICQQTIEEKNIQL